MPSHDQMPLGTRFAERLKRLGEPAHRRFLRLRSVVRPLPRNWWPEFERDFQAYCATSTGRPRGTETDL